MFRYTNSFSEAGIDKTILLGKNDSWIGKLLHDHKCGFMIKLEDKLSESKIELN